MTKPRSLINPNLELAHAQQATHGTSDDNPHSRYPRQAINTEGGHTSDATSFTPRVPTGSRQLSPRNLSQYDFCGMDTAHMAISLGNNH
jgi:hypothetical protein